MSQPLTAEQEWKYAQSAMSWHGWGSPVGIGIFVVSLALAGFVARLAVIGW